MRVAVIGNPVSGRPGGRQRLAQLVSLLQERGHRVELLATTVPGDARQFASELERQRQADRLVVAGGDGTLNEVINGLAEPAQSPLAQLPLGTANVLARELALPRQPTAVADLVECGAARPVRLARANGRRFALMASAGFDAAVVHRVARRRQGHLGFLAYAGPVLHTLAHYQPPTITVRVDGGSAMTGAMALVCNVGNYGAFFQVAHQVDGRGEDLEVCLLPRGSWAALLSYGLAALRRRMDRRRDVLRALGRRIEITSAAPVPVQIDGDPAGHTPVTIERDHATLMVLAPPVKR